MEEDGLLGTVVRNLGAAWRALRLYPPTSPLPLETAGGVCRAAEEYLHAEPNLRLSVAQEGFVFRGIDGVITAPGAPDIADALGAHGVAELHFVAPPMPEEVIAFLSAAQRLPQELRAEGGMQAVLNAAGVGALKVVAVSLQTTEALIEIPEEEADKFLAELAEDPERLASWLRGMLAYDDESLREGLRELGGAADDAETFGRSMGEAFLEQDPDGKDRLLEVSMEMEDVRDIALGMLANLTESDITAAIRGGRYGANAMSVSWALTRLPMGPRTAALEQEMRDALRAADHPETGIAFLDRMIAARRSGSREPGLAETRPLYRSVVEASRLGPEHLAAARAGATARRRLDRQTVATVLGLLDAADTFPAFCSVLSAVAASVPHLIETGDADLALEVAKDLSLRGVDSMKPWPDLDARLAQAMDTACGRRSMTALLAMFASGERAAEHAREFVALGGERAARALADAAMDSEEEAAMPCAEVVLGKQLPELLAVGAMQAEPRHAVRLAEVLARDSGSKCIQALEHMASRPEDLMRRETARGIAAGGGKAAALLMPRLLRDPVPEVAMVSARAMARAEVPGTAEMLAARLGELDFDRDLSVARELIVLLAQSPSEVAEEALRRIAERRSLLRRGRHSEVKRLAREALEARRDRGCA